MSKQSNAVFGCLPFVLGLVLLASLGLCGEECQTETQDGIRSTIRAVQGK